MTTLMYRCPHCRERSEVTLEQVGNVGVCTACGKPFQPEAPAARMLVEREDGTWTAVGEVPAGHRSPGEKTVMTVHPAMFRTSPFKYLGLIIAITIGLTGLVYFGVPIQDGVVDQWWRPVTIVIAVLFGFVALVPLLGLIYWLVGTRFEALSITNERTIWARGILDRETSEVQHDDIRNIQIKQTLVDRILGVGSIAVSSAGQDDMEIDVQGVPNPNRVADTLRSYQARMQGRGD